MKMPEGESKRIEYKVAVPESSEKYMKTVVAFANTQGGRIVFGVDDKTLEVVGMDEETIFQTMDALTNAISDSCEPRIVPNVTMQSVGGKTLIVVEILPGMMRPYYIRSKGMVNGTFTRVAGTSRLVSREMLKELILEGQNRFFDSEPCEGLNVTDDDIANLCASLKETAVRNTVEEKDKLAVKDVTPNVLRSWGVLTEREGKIVPTHAFALLTGRMRFQPVTQCGIFKGTTRGYFVDRREFDGPIQDQMEAAYQYVREKINRGMRLVGVYRQDVYELPIASVRELIANAVVHRSYLEAGNIQVALFDDRLEVTSPGGLMTGVTIEQMKEGYSKPRNRALANAFAYMNLIEKWGSGIPNMIRDCKAYGLPDVEFKDFESAIRINMYRKTTQDTTQLTNQLEKTILSNQSDRVNANLDANMDSNLSKNEMLDANTDSNLSKNEMLEKLSAKLNSKEQVVLKTLEKEPTLTQTALSERTNISLGTIRRILPDLQKKGILRRKDGRRFGYWEIVIN
ncbi:ATP-binding protein [uncultured Selenomonas sp.]|uniref:ATP-binding protein n=1 Tax=uncultured Selenomonas sp. TaxID=159275 RepID=UPI0025E36CE5|nr:ATP-binding protein [uncultured Selenomonas sp.]